MTYGDYPGAEPESARAAARERARELRELHKKQDRRRRILLQGGIASGPVSYTHLTLPTILRV